MRQLSGHDASFLYSDSTHANSNVTLIQIYDQSTAPGGIVRFKSIMAHIESRLDRSPIFRSKLLHAPLELDYPYWIEDENFDLEYHVRHVALPKPGDWRQFCIQASRIHARPLDMNRPLWEIYVMEGLDSFIDLPAGSFALIIKIHHAAIDVEHGSEISMLLHDLSPIPPAVEPPKPWFPESPPGILSLLMHGISKSIHSPFEMGRPFNRALSRLAPVALNFVKDMVLKPEFMTSTRFNSVVSPYRVFDTRRFMVGEFKAITHLVPRATINDAVLAVCGGALRRYLALHDELPANSLNAVAPVYVRAADKAANARPDVSWLRVSLATDVDDPVDRLRIIQHRTSSSDVMAQAIEASELTDIARHAPSATLALASKMLARAATEGGVRMPLANCTITNVPGSAKPVYLNGARMTYFSAIMPIHDGMGLVMAVTSYDGRIVISPTSDRYLMPDPEVFSQCIRDSFQEYLALATMPAAKRPKAPRPAKKAKPAQAPKLAVTRALASGIRKPRRLTARMAATALRLVQGGRRQSTSPSD
ncbi:MAG: wax ester/triacylglycerol synthase family O-acyltransferase [Rhodocyclaceae bacterium]|nr:wax ester/triacylglycerol synthase family O-acyltransferase [Rhodocyclaceae bacterium]MBP6279331.1 wax ester/triacylglycerol synthase family O-acyltransferase [Rhodocyclaceae bacterium]